MSYLEEEFRLALVQYRDTPDYRNDGSAVGFRRGLLAGFKIAVLAYGIWKDGRQRLGAQETPTQDIVKEATEVLQHL